MSILEENIGIRLNEMTDSFKVFCLKMDNDYDHFYKMLNDLDNLEIELKKSITSMSERIENASMNNRQQSLLIECSELIKELKKWQAESETYISKCKQIKSKLKELNITTHNALDNPKNTYYSKIIKALTCLNKLTIDKKLDQAQQDLMETKINTMIQEAFPPLKSFPTDEINEHDFSHIVEKDQEKKLLDETIAEDPSDIMKEQDLPLSSKTDLFNTNQVFQERLIPEEEPIEKEIDAYNIFEPVITPIPVESIPQQRTSKDTIILKREENIRHYLSNLNQIMEKYNIKNKRLLEEIKARMVRFESIQDLANEYNEYIIKLEIINEEIKRVQSLTENEKNNVYLNLRIPNLDMSLSEIEDRLENNIPFDFKRLPGHEFPLIKIPTHELVTIKAPKLEAPAILPEELVKIAKELDIPEEKVLQIIKIINNENLVKKKQGSTFKKNGRLNKFWVKLDQRKKFLLEALLKLERQSLDKEIKPENSDVQNIQLASTLNNNTSENGILDLKNSNINLGDVFTISEGEMVFMDVNLKTKEYPFYSPDTLRIIEGLGVENGAGKIEVVKDHQQLANILNAGGRIISVQSFDGFFDINSIEVKKGMYI